MQEIGIRESDFKMLRKKDYYYIDKSLYIKDIIDDTIAKGKKQIEEKAI